MGTTFKQARQNRLAVLDRQYQELSEIVADPNWINEDYPKYKKAFNDFAQSILALRRLNEVECESETK